MNTSFRERLRGHGRLLGTFLKTPSPIICEILARSPLDFVCIDAEHAPFGRGDIDACVMVFRAAGKPVIVRVPVNAPEHILTALDSGATGILVPHVRSVADARRAVRDAHYGAGGRGYAGSTRAADYAGKAMAAHLRDSRAQTTVIIQIEDIEAVQDVAAIAAVDEVDGLFVGRMDLTVAMGADSAQDPQVIAAVRDVCRAGAAAGRAVGMFVPTTAEVAQWTPERASFYILSSDHGLMATGARLLAEDFQRACRSHS